MPRVTEIAVYKTAAQPALCIRARTEVAALPRLIGESYGKLGALLERRGEFLGDIPYVCYHSMDMADLDVEIGFPLAQALPGEGEIQAGELPGGVAVSCLYRGPYTEMEPVYTEMAAWSEKRGFQMNGTAYEFYYNGPEVAETDYLTKIVLPLKN